MQTHALSVGIRCSGRPIKGLWLSQNERSEVTHARQHLECLRNSKQLPWIAPLYRGLTVGDNLTNWMKVASMILRAQGRASEAVLLRAYLFNSLNTLLPQNLEEGICYLFWWN